MKYIRTKDGRISYLSREPYEDFDEYEIITSKGTLTYRREDEVIKQADTIEELCDAFVDTSELKTTNTGGWLYDEFDSDNKCLVYYEHDERKTIPLNEFDDLSKIRGAIWTDKGLIYVAKMNEKGELELLWTTN